MLPYSLLRLCVDAWDKRPERGAFGTAGLDVADTGVDYNALVIRHGPELHYAEQWHGSDAFTISDTTHKAARLARNHGVGRIDYDAAGVGAGVRGPLREWIRKEEGADVCQPMYVQCGGAGQGHYLPFTSPALDYKQSVFPQLGCSGSDGVATTSRLHTSSSARRGR